ncbi:MAG TPA: hypothetical protein VGB30_01775 [bacterium]|jgi:hypothetical protein
MRGSVVPFTTTVEIQITGHDGGLNPNEWFEVDRDVDIDAAIIPFWPHITGNYNFSQSPFIDPGVGSAIVPAIGDDTYWAAWCERIEMQPPPVNVWATFGWVE